MRNTILATILFVTCLPIDGLTSEEDFVCGMTESYVQERGLGPPAGDIDVRLIYVAFPRTRAAYREYNDARLIDLPEILTEFIQFQSFGAQNLQIEVIKDPRDTTQMWEAEHDAIVYADLNQISQLANYYPTCWSDTTFNKSHTAELQAEMLDKVWLAHEEHYGVGNFDNPFEDVEVVCFVNVPDTTGSPLGFWTDGNFEQYGGYGHLWVKHDCFDFLSTAAIEDVWAPRTQLNGFTFNWKYPEKLLTAAMAMAHEYGHKIGLKNHSPPANYVHDTQQYYYGNYSGMRATYIPDQGPVPYHYMDLFWLGWYSDPVLVTENMRDVVMHDVRDGGIVYQILFGTVGDYLESFLIGYHGGINEDAFVAADSTIIMKSQGLQIQHIVGWYSTLPNNTDIWDLESAFGMYSDPGAFDDPTYWTTPDSISGFDNLDVWPDPNADPPYRDRKEARKYPGSFEDFFSIANGTDEFSFRTNPNTNGYEYLDRRAPQTVRNSIFIKIKEEDPGNSMVVDLLLAPYENITYPNGGEALIEGQSVTITWDHDISEINLVDIHFSDDGGQAYTLLESGVANTGQYTWTPTVDDVTDNGIIKVVFHNDLSIYYHYTGEDTSDGPFAVVPVSLTRYDNRSSETLLDYDGTPYTSVTIDYNDDELKDLLIAIKDEPSELYMGDNINANGVPVFERMTATVFPLEQRPQSGLRGLSIADYDNDGYEDIFAADEAGEYGDPGGPSARLYRNLGTTGITFEDMTDAVGIAPAAAYSWTGAWGDYDGDGWIDLFVCGASGDPNDPAYYTDDPYLDMPATNFFLLKNKIEENGTFEDVTVAAMGIDPYNPETAASCASSWGDMDHDNDLDLFIADIRDFSGTGISSSSIYLNNGDGTLSPHPESYLPHGHKIQGSTGVEWGDFNNDWHLDLAISQESSWITPWVLYNDGTGNFNVLPSTQFDTGSPTIGLQALDHDLDGRLDLIFLPKNSSDHPWLFANKAGALGPVFLDETSTVGLDDLGRVDGAVAADFNKDGDPDLYLGREVSSGGFYYRAIMQSGSDSPANHYVGLELRPCNPPANNAACLGASVTFTSSSATQTQVVDGGSGRGGQKDRILVWGTGSEIENLHAIVNWPNGHSQVEALTVDTFLNVIHDTTNPEVDDGSVVGTYTVKPSGLVDWEFSWDTKFNTLEANDQVEISLASGPGTCEIPPPILKQATGAEVTITRKAGGGYSHVLKWQDRDCVARCTYNFTVTSATDRTSDTSTTHQLRIRFCPQ